MTPLRSILVHADASPATATRLQAAAALARVHGAALEVLYAVLPVYMQYPYSLSLSAQAAAMLQQVESDRLGHARALFDKTVSAGRLTVDWTQATGDPALAFSRAAVCSDLMVLGQYDPDNELRADVARDFVESVIIGSGKPALVIPHSQAPREIGRVVLVAWKPTREAGHALGGSLPLLQAADNVHVALWSESQASDTDERARVARYLERHGVRAEVHGHGTESRDVGEYLLSLSSDLGADLLVMGCYGHGRRREWALGGATRSVLRSMTLPVLMAH